jgi:hypothetical protein
MLQTPADDSRYRTVAPAPPAAIGVCEASPGGGTRVMVVFVKVELSDRTVAVTS